MFKKIAIAVSIVVVASLVVTIVFAGLAFNDLYNQFKQVVDDNQIEITKTELSPDIKRLVVYGYGDANYLKTPEKVGYYTQSNYSEYQYTITEVDENGVAEMYIYDNEMPQFSFDQHSVEYQILRMVNSSNSTTFYIPNEVEVEMRSIHADLVWGEQETTDETTDETIE